MEERIVELETRYAYLEDLVEKLSLVVHEQQQELDALRREARRLREAFAAEPWTQGSMPDEKPPHY